VEPLNTLRLIASGATLGMNGTGAKSLTGGHRPAVAGTATWSSGTITS
jgi:hypothetical protein